MSSNSTILREREVNGEIQIVLYGVASTITLLSHSLIIIVITMKKEMWTRSNFLMGHFSFANILTHIIGVPVIIINLSNGNGITHGAACSVFGFVIFMMFIQYAQNLALIAFHRYILISKNKLYATLFSNIKTVLFIAAIWGVAIIFSMPQLFGLYITNYQFEEAFCMIDWQQNSEYVTVISILTAVIPLLIIMFSYYNVFKTTKESTKRLRSSSMQAKIPKQKRSSPESRLNKMLILVVLEFLVCFTPYIIHVIIEGIFHTKTFPALESISLIIAFSSNMFDILLYFGMSSKFRNALLTLIKAKQRRHSPNVHPAITLQPME